MNTQDIMLEDVIARVQTSKRAKPIGTDFYLLYNVCCVSASNLTLYFCMSSLIYAVRMFVQPDSNRYVCSL